ncbi:uncharacterized protein LOC124092204 [Marmota monax]|uniref:uncharacterized protein LOC124092204 n=1 Tax=Marmota monax TaxID=9995 RepID=UPI0026EF13DA|nr:uncharacterized protein LOC124092204 [Marmota monax]
MTTQNSWGLLANYWPAVPRSLYAELLTGQAVVGMPYPESSVCQSPLWGILGWTGSLWDALPRILSVPESFVGDPWVDRQSLDTLPRILSVPESFVGDPWVDRLLLGCPTQNPQCARVLCGGTWVDRQSLGCPTQNPQCAGVLCGGSLGGQAVSGMPYPESSVCQSPLWGNLGGQAVSGMPYPESSVCRSPLWGILGWTGSLWDALPRILSVPESFVGDPWVDRQSLGCPTQNPQCAGVLCGGSLSGQAVSGMPYPESSVCRSPLWGILGWTGSLWDALPRILSVPESFVGDPWVDRQSLGCPTQNPQCAGVLCGGSLGGQAVSGMPYPESSVYHGSLWRILG